MLTEVEDMLRKELIKLNKHMECAVCLQQMTDPTITRCVHRFCLVCIHKAIESSTNDYCKCPLCNEKITKRSLRPQPEFAELIQAFNVAVGRLQKDVNKDIITNADEVVVFDVSSDRSKSSASITANDSIDTSIDSKINASAVNNTMEVIQHMSVDDLDEDWPSCDTDKDMDHSTEKVLQTSTSKSPAKPLDVQTTDKCADNKDKVNGNVNPSQNLTVNKSKITYGSTKKPVNDKFDKIINSSNYQMNANDGPKELAAKQTEPKSKPVKVPKVYVSSDSEPEVESLDKRVKTYQRKPLMNLKDKTNRDVNQKKPKKRVMQALMSSDDELSSPVFVTNKKKVAVINETLQNQWLNSDAEDF